MLWNRQFFCIEDLFAEFLLAHAPRLASQFLLVTGEILWTKITDWGAPETKVLPKGVFCFGVSSITISSESSQDGPIRKIQCTQPWQNIANNFFGRKIEVSNLCNCLISLPLCNPCCVAFRPSRAMLPYWPRITSCPCETDRSRWDVSLATMDIQSANYLKIRIRRSNYDGSWTVTICHPFRPAQAGDILVI